MILSPASRPVQALIPNDVMPKWWRTGRQGSRPSVTSSMSSRRATAYSLIDTSPGYSARDGPTARPELVVSSTGVGRAIPHLTQIVPQRDRRPACRVEDAPFAREEEEPEISNASRQALTTTTSTESKAVSTGPGAGETGLIDRRCSLGWLPPA